MKEELETEGNKNRLWICFSDDEMEGVEVSVVVRPILLCDFETVFLSMHAKLNFSSKTNLYVAYKDF